MGHSNETPQQWLSSPNCYFLISSAYSLGIRGNLSSLNSETDRMAKQRRLLSAAQTITDNTSQPGGCSALHHSSLGISGGMSLCSAASLLSPPAHRRAPGEAGLPCRGADGGQQALRARLPSGHATEGTAAKARRRPVGLAGTRRSGPAHAGAP